MKKLSGVEDRGYCRGVVALNRFRGQEPRKINYPALAVLRHIPKSGPVSELGLARELGERHQSDNRTFKLGCGDRMNRPVEICELWKGLHVEQTDGGVPSWG